MDVRYSRFSASRREVSTSSIGESDVSTRNASAVPSTFVSANAPPWTKRIRVAAAAMRQFQYDTLISALLEGRRHKRRGLRRLPRTNVPRLSHYKTVIASELSIIAPMRQFGAASRVRSPNCSAAGRPLRRLTFRAVTRAALVTPANHLGGCH